VLLPLLLLGLRLSGQLLRQPLSRPDSAALKTHVGSYALAKAMARLAGVSRRRPCERNGEGALLKHGALVGDTGKNPNAVSATGRLVTGIRVGWSPA